MAEVKYEVVVRRTADGEVTGERAAWGGSTWANLNNDAPMGELPTATYEMALRRLATLARELEDESKPRWRWTVIGGELDLYSPDGNRYRTHGLHSRIGGMGREAVIDALNALEEDR